MKLQKLVYYAQAWSLAWDGSPLFGEELQAWKYGPVSPRLYGMHKHEGGFEGNPERLSANQKATIAAVVRFYGKQPATWLAELSHREDPWMKARGPLPTSAPSNAVITHESMREWYSQIPLQPREFTEAFERGLEFLVDTPEDELPYLFEKPQPAGEYIRWLETGGAWQGKQ